MSDHSVLEWRKAHAGEAQGQAIERAATRFIEMIVKRLPCAEMKREEQNQFRLAYFSHRGVVLHRRDWTDDAAVAP
jgi:hypothetical protein